MTYQFLNLENKEKALLSIQVSTILQTQYLKCRDLVEYPSIDWRIILVLKWILKKIGWRAWTVFI
jgi:hypothetical protein